MKFLLLGAALLLYAAAAQASPTPKASPVNPIPYADADTKGVLVPINALFAAFEAGDAATMLRHVYPDGHVTASGMRGDGASNLREQSWTQFAARIPARQGLSRAHRRSDVPHETHCDRVCEFLG